VCPNASSKDFITLCVRCLSLHRSSVASASPHLRHPFVPQDLPPVPNQCALKHQTMRLYCIMHLVCHCATLPPPTHHLTPNTHSYPGSTSSPRPTCSEVSKMMLYYFMHVTCRHIITPFFAFIATPLSTSGIVPSPLLTCSKASNKHTVPLHVLCLLLRRPSATNTSPHPDTHSYPRIHLQSLPNGLQSTKRLFYITSCTSLAAGPLVHRRFVTSTTTTICTSGIAPICCPAYSEP
jgi:hypothetical protein